MFYVNEYVIVMKAFNIYLLEWHEIIFTKKECIHQDTGKKCKRMRFFVGKCIEGKATFVIVQQLPL